MKLFLFRSFVLATFYVNIFDSILMIGYNNKNYFEVRNSRSTVLETL